MKKASRQTGLVIIVQYRFSIVFDLFFDSVFSGDVSGSTGITQFYGDWYHQVLG
jgi:hypothetical protein